MEEEVLKDRGAEVRFIAFSILIIQKRLYRIASLLLQDYLLLKEPQRITNRFTEVEFPIRIGEHNQFDDGLVGYWIEDRKTYKDKTFYAPQSCYIDHPEIETLYENKNDEQAKKTKPVNLVQNLEPETAQTLVMLIDPRSKVHASCGVLPSKAIQIPPEQYQAAMEAIQVVFFSGLY